MKLVILTGQPGSGKNSLLEVYAKENNFRLIRYKD